MQAIFVLDALYFALLKTKSPKLLNHMQHNKFGLKMLDHTTKIKSGHPEKYPCGHANAYYLAIPQYRIIEDHISY